MTERGSHASVAHTERNNDMRSIIGRPTGRARLMTASLLVALPLSMATACAEDERVENEGGVEEGVGEEGDD